LLLARVAQLCLAHVAGWLASLLACFAGIAGSLAGAHAQLSSLGASLGLVSLRSALRPWLALLARCLRRWLPSLGLHQLTSAPIVRCFAHIVSQASLGFARLALLARIAQLCLARIAGWLAPLLACVAGVADSLAGVRCWLTLLAPCSAHIAWLNKKAQQKGLKSNLIYAYIFSP